MIVDKRLPQVMRTPRPSGSFAKSSVAIGRTGRLIQVALALYLIPVFLIVLAMGSLGMLVLGTARLFGAMETVAARRV